MPAVIFTNCMYVEDPLTAPAGRDAIAMGSASVMLQHPVTGMQVALSYRGTQAHTYGGNSLDGKHFLLNEGDEKLIADVTF